MGTQNDLGDENPNNTTPEPERSEENVAMITVEVAYAKPDVQVIKALKVEQGTTVEQAIEQSGILVDFPEIDITATKVGIFSKIAKKDRVLCENDRVEIYRPLIADPKEVRKKRAAQGKKMRKGGG